jgi:L-lactate dehydrogenase complex protein LldG
VARDGRREEAHVNAAEGSGSSAGRVAGGVVRDEARAEVMERIRHSLRDRPVAPEVPVTAGLLGVLGPDALLELFAERVAEYRATVHRTMAADLPRAVAAVLARRGARRVAVPAGLPADWLATAGVEQVSDVPPLAVDALDALDGVITTCAVGIAETGTLVLDGGSGQGRRALSLLPDRHLCVIRADQIVQDVPEALARLDPRRPMTWISGPSATSDIELQRVEGVHGPRVLDVVIVELGSTASG